MTNERGIVKAESAFINKAKKFLILLAIEIILAIILFIVIQVFR